MAITWSTPSGSLGTIEERTEQNITLLATTNLSETITYSLHAGKLPKGLRLVNNKIIGTPFEVLRPEIFRFVIRASDSQEIKDRTFSLQVTGSDEPVWSTPEGLLPVGPNSTFFVLDNSRVDFQLIALDPDFPAGDTIEYYIPYNGGELPPGLSLSKDGKISGYTDPIFALEYKVYSGNYDLNLFDSAPYDLGLRPVNGFDSFTFDDRAFDFFEETNFPRRLSRYYQFTVVATDGLYESRRSFQIYIVSEEFLRADNTIIQVGTGIFRADNTYVRNPLWITESNLGQRRANNYLTVYLDVYDPPNQIGYISYRFEIVNPKFRAKTTDIARDNSSYIDLVLLPNSDGDYGTIRPGQLMAVTDRYNFLDSTLGSYTVASVEKLSPSIEIPSQYRYRVYLDPNVTEKIKKDVEVFFGTRSNLPPGLELDTINGELVGRVPYQPRITEEYEFTVTATNNYPTGISASTAKTFNIKILGEIESGITWISDRLLGEISPNKNSQLVVEAVSKLRGGAVIYKLRSGKLPPGLKLLPTGEIIGKVNLIGSEIKTGVTRFFDKYLEITDIVGTFNNNSIITGSTSGAEARIINIDTVKKRLYYKELDISNPAFFDKGENIVSETAGAKCVNQSKEINIQYDGGLSTFDRFFNFVVEAKDIFNYTESAKTFQIRISSTSPAVFSNMYFKLFQKKSKRLLWSDFISDPTVFVPEQIYRYGDPSFGVQDELKMLMFAGIESKDAVSFVQALSRNHNYKRFKFGSVKKAVGKDQTTQDAVYEVVYIEIIDPLIKNNKSISRLVDLPDYINRRILASQDNISVNNGFDIFTPASYLVSDRDFQRIFPNSIKNMRDRIKNVGERDRSYLPLWMRSIQDEGFVEPGFVSAIPICYCKPGQADDIILNIKNTEFDFKNLDFEVDRYIIDSIDGILEDQYLLFPTGIKAELEEVITIEEGEEGEVFTFDSNNNTFDNSSVTFDRGS